MAADNIYAIATATAKKAGYSNFEEGSEGEKKREEIVLALKRRGMKKAQKYIRSGDLKMRDARPGRDLAKNPYTSDELLRDNNPTVRRQEQRRVSLEDYRAKRKQGLMKKADDTRKAARYQFRGREPSNTEQREPVVIPKKDPNRVKQGKWEGGKWISNAVQEIWKATYGANNDQARKTGQRTNVKRNPRLNPNKLGVSDILKARLPKQPPEREPKKVREGYEDDLYPTGTQFSVERKNQFKKSLLWMLLGKEEDEWALPKPKGSTVFSVQGKTKEQKKEEQKAGQKAMAERTARSGLKRETAHEAMMEANEETPAEAARLMGTEEGQQSTKRYHRAVASGLNEDDRVQAKREKLARKRANTQVIRGRQKAKRAAASRDLELYRQRPIIDPAHPDYKPRPEQGKGKNIKEVPRGKGTGAKWAQAKDRWSRGIAGKRVLSDQNGGEEYQGKKDQNGGDKPSGGGPPSKGDQYRW